MNPEKVAIKPMAAFSNNSNFFLAISHKNTIKVFFKSADGNRTNTLIANSLQNPSNISFIENTARKVAPKKREDFIYGAARSAFFSSWLFEYTGIQTWFEVMPKQILANQGHEFLQCHHND